MKIFLILPAFILFLVSCTQKETITNEEVKAALNRFDNGWKNKNPRLVDSVLSASYIYFTQSGGVFDRRNVVNTAGSPEYKLDTMSRAQFEIRIDGNTAVVNTIWTGKGTYYGVPFNDRQRCSVTLIKKDGKVEILSEHCTPVK